MWSRIHITSRRRPAGRARERFSQMVLHPTITLQNRLILFNIAPLFLADDDISYATHIGGFVAGMILGVIYGVAARRRAVRA